MADVPATRTAICMFIDPRGRLWLVWVTILANEWHTALLRCRIAEDYQADGPPTLELERRDSHHAGEDFAAAVQHDCEREEARLESVPAPEREEWRSCLENRRRHADDKYFPPPWAGCRVCTRW